MVEYANSQMATRLGARGTLGFHRAKCPVAVAAAAHLDACHPVVAKIHLLRFEVMARILSISYDETLLLTRELMLSGAGHEVTSALGFHRSVEACRTGGFDLFVLGHSIPKDDKLDLIQCFREKNPGALVIALTRANEPRLKEVDLYLNPGDPAELLRGVAFLTNPSAERRRSNRTGAALVPKKSP